MADRPSNVVPFAKARAQANKTRERSASVDAKREKNRREALIIARDDDLAASGLAKPAVIEALKLTTVLDQVNTEALTGISGAISYEIPYFDIDGKPTKFSRWKLIGGEDGDSPRYYQEPKTIPRVYMPTLPKLDWRKVATDATKRIVLTEGEKKAACACVHKIICLGLGGVWNWKSSRWRLDMLRDFDDFAWEDREVELCFDGDLASNEDVRRASDFVLANLKSRGARVFVRRLPNTDGSHKLDDFLVTHGVEAYLKLPCEEWFESAVSAPQDPLPNARRILKSEFAHPDHVRLVTQAGTFYQWDGTCWPSVEDAQLRALLYQWAEGKSFLRESASGVKQAPFMPDRTKIANLIDALRSATHLDEKTPSPSWLDGRTKPPAGELISCRNGLLHWPTRKLHAHTPLHYGRYSLPFAFDPKAPKPKRWLAFLAQLWPKDQQSIATLQQMFGYMVSGDTRLQKMFMIYGPVRGGKGTIGRILTAVMGAHNVAGPSLHSLSGEFGLWDLIDKPVAVIPDARLGRRTDGTVLTERLLSISGEDSLSVNRKNLAHWQGKLPTRILMLTSELPRFTDSSGGVANRFIVLRLTESFLGRENPALTDELSSELPGILNWSLDGLRELRKRGRFMQPSASQEAISDMEDLASPVTAFIRECCVIKPKHEVPTDDVFRRWVRWCARDGHNSGAKETFGKNLRAAMPSIERRQRGGRRDKHWAYIGVSLQPEKVEWSQEPGGASEHEA